MEILEICLDYQEIQMLPSRTLWNNIQNISIINLWIYIYIYIYIIYALSINPNLH